MKNKQWEAIHEVYTRMEKLCGRSLYISEESLFTGRGERPDNEDIESRMQAQMSIASTILCACVRN